MVKFSYITAFIPISHDTFKVDINNIKFYLIPFNVRI